MMGVGYGEMVVLAIIALVVMGPEKFPEFAKIILRTYRDMRGYVEDAKRDITKELRPVQREIAELSKYNPEDYIDKLTSAVAEDLDEKVESSAPAALPADPYAAAAESKPEESKQEPEQPSEPPPPAASAPYSD